MISALVSINRGIIPQPLLIAVDGTAISGKGTLAKNIAEVFGIRHLDSGLLYRATAAILFDREHNLNDVEKAVEAASSISEETIARPDLRDSLISRNVSAVSAIPQVREIVTSRQKQFAAASPTGAVIDGRATAVEVLPDAHVKLFIDADPDVRAMRRCRDLVKQGKPADPEKVKAEILERDRLDSSRECFPLKMAVDAHLVDNTNLNPNETLEAAVNRIIATLAGRQLSMTT